MGTDLSTPSDEGSEIPDSGEELHELGEVSDEDDHVKHGSMLVLTIAADSRQRDLIKAIPPIICTTWASNGLCDTNKYVAESCGKECGGDRGDASCGLLDRLSRESLTNTKREIENAKAKLGICEDKIAANQVQSMD